MDRENTKIRVLCVDDNVEFLQMFELVTSDHLELETVGALHSAEGLEERVRELRPDMILLDFAMPGRTAVDAIKEVKAQFPEIRILVSSAYDDRAFVDQALKAGANGYLIKGGDFNAVVEAIHRVMAGQIVLHQWNDRIRTIGVIPARGEQLTS